MKKLLIALLCSFAIQAQTFDFSCEPQSGGGLSNDDPMKYYNEFIVDAATYGWDFGDQTGEITLIDLPNGINAQTNGKCLDTDFYVQIDREKWMNPALVIGSHDISNTKNLWRKYILYHELGHAFMNLNHVCNEETRPHGYSDSTYVYYFDIMTSTGQCGGNIATLFEPYYFNHQLNGGIDRMFRLEGQEVNACNTPVITCNLLTIEDGALDDGYPIIGITIENGNGAILQQGNQLPEPLESLNYMVYVDKGTGGFSPGNSYTVIEPHTGLSSTICY